MKNNQRRMHPILKRILSLFLVIFMISCSLPLPTSSSVKLVTAAETTISSMTATDGPVLTANPTGSVGFTYPIFNGNPNIPYASVAHDLKVYVKALNSTQWIDIDNNPASGWIYDQNFGQFTDGPGGYWFVLSESINVKLEAISSGASLIYTLLYSEPVRNSYRLSPYEGKTRYEANESGSIGIPLPKIDGSAAINKELDSFVYEIKMNGKWVPLNDYSSSGFSYSANGYNDFSDANQWGYWVDYIYGLWFKPIQVDMEIRIGYPINGQKGGYIGDNYVTYTLIGNPNAPRPNIYDLASIKLGTPDNPKIEGYNLIWHDEFNAGTLDMSLWNYDTGYYLNDDPGTWGWGNNELQWYSDSEKNVFLKDGKLHLRAYEEPKSFPQDPNRYARYSSGKVTTKDKFTFKYGRIDFRAKLPKGNGLWPAFWLLPNDNIYGTWAASGEIDVMEARGRLPGSSSGALHFGGAWPANTYISGEYTFPEGKTIDSDFHVYSLVWEEDNMKWYVDGKCFFKATSDQWYSLGAQGNPLAPFDQEFYIIMNLAVGGWFDGGITPNPGEIPATVEVDYVRVYKPSKESTEPDPDIGDGEDIGNEVCGLKRINNNIEFYVNGATFADLHYRINNSGLINVAMNSIGNGNFTYLIKDLKQGDLVEYFFTYNPGTGALDTETYTYIHGSSQEEPDSGEYQNVAMGKGVTVSGSENEQLIGAYLTDNNLSTRWSSNWSDDAWFIIDLGKSYRINKIILNWEAAFGRQYEILVSEDGKHFTKIFNQSNGTGGIETINFAEVKARYVKLQGIQRGLPYGYSLYDVKVMGK